MHRVHSHAQSNAIAERFVLSVKTECIHRMVLFGEDSIRRALQDYCFHFNEQRPHQGLGNELVTPGIETGAANGEIVETERLGGLLRSYELAA